MTQALGSADGVTITGPPEDRYERGAHRPRAGADRTAAPRASTAAGASCWTPARSGTRSSPPAARSTSCAETKDVREDESWRVAEPAPGLVDRRVEITGPTDRKMTINALNSGAKVWLADQEDANTPLWEQRRQRPAQPAATRSTGTIDFTSPGGQGLQARATTVDHDRGPPARLAPAGEAHPGRRRADLGQPGRLRALPRPTAAGALDAGQGPYFYLPKMESHLEARLWNDAFVAGAGLPRHPRAARSGPPCSIETYPAAFEMEEILYELREHSAGLNAGRWDYLFSVIKKFRTRGADFMLPDRNSVTMTAPFMRAYTELLVRTCHKRGAHAIGGMAAFIPSRRDAEVNEVAMQKVREDKTREANDGFDGSWVAHPGHGRRCAGRSSTPSSATGPTSSTGCARTCTSPPPSCWTCARRRARSPRPGCATTSASASSTSSPGCAAAARWRSTT